MKKSLIVVIGLIFTFSIISVTFFSYQVCDTKKIEEYSWQTIAEQTINRYQLELSTLKQ